MKVKARILVAVLLMVFVVFVGQSSAQEMGRYIVHTTGDSFVNEAARQAVEDRAGLTLKGLPTGTGLVVLIPDVARGPIASIPGVVAVEPDVVLTAVAEVLPWGVDRIDADLVWGTVTGAGVDIAIIDTGIDKDHLDLAVAGGTNFVRKGRRVDPDAWDDDNGHGTHCAGIAAALDNDIGVVGVAPAALLYGVKVLDRSGSGYLSDVMDGIYWAADNGMEVMNLSLGIDKDTLDQYPSDRDALEAAVDYADGLGVVVVAAAGNEGNGADTVIYPARFESAIAVAATDNSDSWASFSSTGDSVELAAPGVSIYSTYKDGGYATGSGTSMAAPHVAGTAALMISAGVYSRDTLTSTAEDLGDSGWDPYYGHGLVDAAAAADVSEEPPADAPPTVNITNPADGDTISDTITIEAEASDDVGVTQVAFYIDDVELATDTEAPYSCSWGTSTVADGSHTITAKAIDTIGQTTSAAITVTVDNINDPPVADAGTDQSAFVDETVTFDGSASYDPDGSIASYDWDFGDEIAGSGITTTHAYSAPGTYTVTLTVTDNDGLIAKDTAIVTVTEQSTLVMHVASIDIVLDTRTAGRNTFTKALATVTILDASFNPVEGAMVYGHWSSATTDSDSGLTDTEGKVTLESDAVKNAPSGTIFTFTVDDVVKSGWTYDPQS